MLPQLRFRSNDASVRKHLWHAFIIQRDFFPCFSCKYKRYSVLQSVCRERPSGVVWFVGLASAKSQFNMDFVLCTIHYRKAISISDEFHIFPANSDGITSEKKNFLISQKWTENKSAERYIDGIIDISTWMKCIQMRESGRTQTERFAFSTVYFSYAFNRLVGTCGAAQTRRMNRWKDMKKDKQTYFILTKLLHIDQPKMQTFHNFFFKKSTNRLIMHTIFPRNFPHIL